MKTGMQRSSIDERVKEECVKEFSASRGNLFFGICMFYPKAARAASGLLGCYYSSSTTTFVKTTNDSKRHKKSSSSQCYWSKSLNTTHLHTITRTQVRTKFTESYNKLQNYSHYIMGSCDEPGSFPYLHQCLIFTCYCKRCSKQRLKHAKKLDFRQTKSNEINQLCYTC